MPSTYLVTGGAGFIGSSIVRALLGRGDEVRVLDNFFSGKRENLADVARDIELVEGDVRDESVTARACAGVEVVLHEAAIASVPRSLADPIATNEANVSGTLNVLHAAKKAGVRRVVYAGSSSAYGDTPTLPKIETMPPSPLSPYAVSKLAGEHYCQVFASAYALETVCLRYFNVFGPRQDPRSEYAAVIPRFVTAGLAGEGVTIFGDGLQSRDFCYIDNTVAANLAAVSAPASAASGRVFNVACGVAIALNEVVRLISDNLGRPIPITYAPARVGDVMHSLADISAARARLGYEAAISFDDGLRRTIAWYAARRGC
jgi:UDP-glucose 4-epimerase